MKRIMILVVICLVLLTYVTGKHYVIAGLTESSCIKDGDPAFYIGFGEDYREVSRGETVHYELLPANYGFISSCSQMDTFCCHLTDTKNWVDGELFYSDPMLGEAFTLDSGNYIIWNIDITVPCAEVGDNDTIIAMMAFCDVDGVCAPECGDCEDPNWSGGIPHYFADTLVLHVVPGPTSFHIMQDSIFLVDQGKYAVYVPFVICNDDPCLPQSYNYEITSRGHVGPPISWTDVVGPISPGECKNVYGIIDASEAEICDRDTLEIIAWSVATPVAYDTCEQAIHVIEYRGAQILPGWGVNFYQIDFTYEGAELYNSSYGMIVVNVDSLRAASGLSAGYINVQSDFGWVVRNLPIYEGDCSNTTSTMFKLHETPEGFDIASINVCAEISESPTVMFSGTPNTLFPVGTREHNAQGFDSLRTEPPTLLIDMSVVEFSLLGRTNWHTNPFMPNIEQANCQCAPASVANSLQWLEDRYEDIRITDDHAYGIGASGDHTLVAELDNEMGRGADQGLGAISIIAGKLKYITNNDRLYEKLDVYHKEGPGYDDVGDKVTVGKATSREDKSKKSLFEWIMQELKVGKDVELGFLYPPPEGGGHFVVVTEAGYVRNAPYIRYSDDAMQGSPILMGLRDYAFSYIDKNGRLVAEVDKPTMSIAFSEGPKVKNKQNKDPKKPKEESNAGGDEGLVLAQYDFEPNPQGWNGVDLDVYRWGDFAGRFGNITDHDPLNNNSSMVVTFFNGSGIPSSSYPGLFDVTYGWAVWGQPMRRLQNEWRSPLIPLAGTGSSFILQMSLYLDNPLDNLVFATWHICSHDAATGLYGPWKDLDYLYYSESPSWIPFKEEVGPYIDPGATHVRLAVAAWDMVDEWGGSLGTGSNHTPAPFFDNIKLSRVNTAGPMWRVRDIDLFQDVFPENGTQSGTCRMDIAKDVMPRDCGIRPGDSLVVSVGDPEHDLGTDPTYGKAAVYIHVHSTGGQSPLEISGSDSRWPFVSEGDGWTKILMDAVDDAVREKFCVDLNDSLFTNGDTVFYYFSAINGAAFSSYWSQHVGTTTSEAVVRGFPNEVTCLPTGSSNILYVNASGSRGMTPYFESAFEMLDITPDRYDVLGPTSLANNGIASRAVKEQLIGRYSAVLYNSGDLEDGAIGNGSGTPLKTSDVQLLTDFLALSETDVGLYLSGDGIAEVIREVPSALLNYISYAVTCGSYYEWTGGQYAGGTISPLVTSELMGIFGAEHSFFVHGGPPIVNAFDILEPYGTAQVAMSYPEWEGFQCGAVLTQETLNEKGCTARIVLSGFSFHEITNIPPSDPPWRVRHLHKILTWFDTGAYIPSDVEAGPPLVTRAYQNYPNPFNATTLIRFSLKEKSRVSLKVYNVAGQLIRTIIDEVLPAGIYTDIGWDGTNNKGNSVGSGIYFYRFAAGDFVQTRKMVLLR